MEINKISQLLTAHFTIGSRLSIGVRQRVVSLILYILYCANPIFIVYGNSNVDNVVVPITLFAFWNFTIMSLIRTRFNSSFKIYQLKIYPVSDASILKLLWLTELLDYNSLALIVPAITCIIILYPDLSMILMYMITLVMFYFIFSLVLLKAKLIMAYSRIFNGVVIATIISGIIVLAKSLENIGQWEFETFYTNIPAWIIGVSFIFLFSLLYSLTILTFSKLTR